MSEVPLHGSPRGRGERFSMNEVPHPGVELRANLESIFRRRFLFEEAFVWQLTKETIHLPLGCLQGGFPARREHKKIKSVYLIAMARIWR